MPNVTEHQLLAGVWNTDPIIQALSGTSAPVQLVIGKLYTLVGTKALRFKQGASDVVASATSNYLAEGAAVVIKAIEGYDYVAVIQHATGGEANFMHPTQGGES